jgi:hypothetical protein
MSRNVTITLNSNAGSNLGPNFNVTITGGTISPTTATRSELLGGKIFEISSNAAETITVTSTGDCTNSSTVQVPTAVHNFSSTPVPGGTTGTINITAGTAPSSIVLTGSPFAMIPNPLTFPTTTATLNFTDGSFTTNTTISFTLVGTSTATPFNSPLRIQDSLTNIYDAVLSGGSGTGNNVVVTFNLGAPSNRTFSFLGGEINLQFLS